MDFSIAKNYKKVLPQGSLGTRKGRKGHSNYKMSLRPLRPLRLNQFSLQYWIKLDHLKEKVAIYDE